MAQEKVAPAQRPGVGGEHRPPRVMGRHAPRGQTRSPLGPCAGQGTARGPSTGERPPALASEPCALDAVHVPDGTVRRACPTGGGEGPRFIRAERGAGPGARAWPLPCGQTGAARPEPACAPRGHRPHSVLLGKPSTMPCFLRFRSGDWVTENSQNRMASFSTREREPRPLENFWKQSGVSGRPPGPPSPSPRLPSLSVVSAVIASPGEGPASALA